ncbi:hypothetical protein [Massilia soli]|uniref:Uncharacterized protein n=1 Tax=Massilia soli TaxID=2792854 RepID=A0ABS7SK36_9BURK|nr:hypothetical protein [Massilia soli]MBZ2206116.1 hypothetical protein [Massilia soli]
MTYQEQQAAEPAPHNQISARGAARRRFARAGVGASAALVTISSKAGMAVDICTAPSGSLSGGLQSQKPGEVIACEGRSPGYWKNHAGWPTDRAMTFGTIFSCSTSSKYHACTLADMLVPKRWDRNGIGRHMVATYLNIMSGKIGFLTVPALQEIWNDISRRGVYNPTAGVNWYAQDVVDYLQGTMG